LVAYVADAVSWRVVVVGGRAVAACRNAVGADDFRSHSTEAAADHTANPPRAIARLAVRAVRALRLEFGGVDILAAPDGRLWLLESNFPCYFAHAWDIGGIDVAGAMVAHLMAKAHRLRAQIIRASNGGSRSGASNSTTQRSGSRFTARAT
jgi:glutathione synthase/RimK-type ligase-like ATP-grasp enzyme